MLTGLVLGVALSACVSAPAQSISASSALHAVPVSAGMADVPFDLGDLERRILREVNAARRAAGRSPLTPDPEVTSIARAHSRAMAQQSFYDHRDLAGRLPADRAYDAGYRFQRYGENLFAGALFDTKSIWREGGRTRVSYLWYTPDELAATVVEGWMESVGHRENMLSGFYSHFGVGVATTYEHRVFVTLNLSAP